MLLSGCTEDLGLCSLATSGESCDVLYDCRRGCDNDIACLNSCEAAVSYGLRDCRRRCDNDIACLNSCEAAASPGCKEKLDALATCGSDQNCTPGAYESCCSCEFESAFPGHPVFSSTPCEECSTYCNGDVSCLNDCISDESVCNNCIRDACSGDICSAGVSQCSGT